MNFMPFWFVCGCKYLGCKICALSDRVIETIFTPALIFILCCTSYLFRIISLLWVVWNQQRRIWKIESDSGSVGLFGIRLSGFLHGVGLPLGVSIYSDDSCIGDGSSLVP